MRFMCWHILFVCCVEDVAGDAVQLLKCVLCDLVHCGSLMLLRRGTRPPQNRIRGGIAEYPLGSCDVPFYISKDATCSFFLY